MKMAFSFLHRKKDASKPDATPPKPSWIILFRDKLLGPKKEPRPPKVKEWVQCFRDKKATTGESEKTVFYCKKTDEVCPYQCGDKDNTVCLQFLLSSRNAQKKGLGL